MRYFIRTDTVEKGPFDLASIKESIREGRLPREVQVRQENQDEWVPADELRRTPPLAARRTRREASERDERPIDTAAPSIPSAEQGSFLLGFIAGLLGGLLVVALVLRRGKPDTKVGVYLGFGLHVMVLLVVRNG